MRKKLIWIGPEFTPYHEYLFENIATNERFELHVEMLHGPSRTHPFVFRSERPYSFRIIGNSYGSCSSLIRHILSEPTATVIVASYTSYRLLSIMRALAYHQRQFIYFTDTPLPQAEQWGADRLVSRSIIRRIGRHLCLSWIFRTAQYVFATGQVGVDSVVSLGCPREKAVVFPFFVPLGPYDPSAKNRDTLRFTSVGQLIKRKGLDLAIQAFTQVVPSLRNTRWTWSIIGDGDQRVTLQQQVMRAHLQEHIRFQGWLSPLEIQDALASSHLFIHPSLWDPFPVAVLEAMAAGSVVLGSDRSGSVLDRVENGVNGFIHQTANVSELANQIALAMTDQTRIMHMGVQARRTAEEWPVSRGANILAAHVS